MDEDVTWDATSERYLGQVVDYVRERPWIMDDETSFAQAASDVLDGNALASEVRPLVRSRVLRTMPVRANERTLGNRVTWDLTARGRDIVRDRVSSSTPKPKAPSFEEWLAVLKGDVIVDEYGFPPDEFEVVPDQWRPLFERGLAPDVAFRRALDAFAASRRDPEAAPSGPGF